MTFSPSSLTTLPESSGIYKFLDAAGTILYVGKAKNIKNRVSNYFHNTLSDPKTKRLVSQIKEIEVISVQSEFEALLLESQLIKTYLPKYNVIWKDDRQYIYIKITKEEFPRILISRKEEKNEGDFFGPFPSGKTVRNMLSYIRTIFPYCTQSPHIKRTCFYTHIGLCNPCPGALRREKSQEIFQSGVRAYRKNIHNVRMFLSGKHTWVVTELEKEMKVLVKEEKFEQAGVIRDRLRQANYLIHEYTPADSYIENPVLFRSLKKQEAKDLKNILKPFFIEIKNITKIECYDISNVSGKHATGAMVTFVKGVPDKKLYRRFKIRTKDTPDDFSMLSEMLSRRLKHTEWKLPDLFVIDGGTPQLRALSKVLTEFNISIPAIGLAKQFEEIVVPMPLSSSRMRGSNHLNYNNNGVVPPKAGDNKKDLQFTKLNLPRNSPALHLVQRLRDEAHRFAKRYHHHLHTKALLGTLRRDLV